MTGRDAAGGRKPAGVPPALVLRARAIPPLGAEFLRPQDQGGRPLLGKRHFLKRADVDRLYPQAERYRQVRRQADPQGKFLNPHLTELFS